VEIHPARLHYSLLAPVSFHYSSAGRAVFGSDATVRPERARGLDGWCWQTEPSHKGRFYRRRSPPDAQGDRGRKKINDVYQPLYHLSKPNDSPQIVKLSEEQIIPMAEKSRFEETRNKYVFLANREIAGCEMASGHYKDAEHR
jgi:hypothetical protein